MNYDHFSYCNSLVSEPRIRCHTNGSGCSLFASISFVLRSHSLFLFLYPVYSNWVKDQVRTGLNLQYQSVYPAFSLWWEDSIQLPYGRACQLDFTTLIKKGVKPNYLLQDPREYHMHCIEWMWMPEHWVGFGCLTYQEGGCLRNTRRRIRSVFEPRIRILERKMHHKKQF